MKSFFIFTLSLLFIIASYSQSNYKLVFEGEEHTTANRVLASTEDGFIVNVIKRISFPNHFERIILGDLYTFDNVNPYDSTHWEIQLSRPDTLLSVYGLYKKNGYVLLGSGTHYTYNDTTMIVKNRFNWIAQLDNERNKIWEKFLPYPEELRKTSLTSYTETKHLRSGNYLVAQTVQNDSTWVNNILLLEINPTGNIVKTKVFDQSISGNIQALNYNHDSSSILLHKIGWELYDCQIGSGAFILDTLNYDIIGGACVFENGQGFDSPYEAKLLPNGDLIVAGTYVNYIPSPRETFLGVRRFNTNYEYTHEILLTAPDTITYAAWGDCLDFITPDEIFVAATFDGALGQYNIYPDWIYLAKLDSELNLIEERYIGGDADYEPFSIAATMDGGMAIVGNQYDYLVNEENETDAFVIKTDGGLWLNVPVNKETNIHQAIVYPNPGCNTVYVRTSLKKSVIRFYNTKGQIVLNKPLNQLITALSTFDLHSGVYTWTITKANQVFDSGKWVKIPLD